MPAPKGDGIGTGARQAPQIATRASNSGVRRPSGAAARTKCQLGRHPGPMGAADRYARLSPRRPLPVWGRCLHQMPTRGTTGSNRRPRSLRAAEISASGRRLGPVAAPNAGPQGIPAQDGRRTPRKQKRVAILGAWGGRMGLSSAFGAGISPDGRRTPGREERVAICGGTAGPPAPALGPRARMPGEAAPDLPAWALIPPNVRLWTGPFLWGLPGSPCLFGPGRPVKGRRRRSRSDATKERP